MVPRKLLVIDDSATIRKLLEISFRGAGCLIEFAESGGAGVSAAKEMRPDVILLDYVLPDMRATDVCERLGKDSLTNSIPVIVMSGKTDGIRDLFRDLKMAVDFVAKPFDAAEIVRRVKLAMEMQVAPKEVAKAAFQDRGRFPGHVPSGATFRGELRDWPLLPLISTIENAKTGTLELRFASLTVTLFVQAGEVVLVSCDDPTELEKALKRPLRGGGGFSSAAAPEWESGTPKSVTLLLGQRLPQEAASAALFAAGRKLLSDACSAQEVAFEWHSRPMPREVEMFGRPISKAQIVLDTLRLQPGFVDLVSDDAVFERAPDFSTRIRGIDLSDEERSVLTLLSTNGSVEDLSNRGSTPAEEQRAVVARLLAAGLLRRSRVTRPLREQKEPVLAVDPDAGQFLSALDSLLSRCKTPIRLVTASPGEDLVSAVLRLTPRLLLLNADAVGTKAEQIARSVRFSLRHSRMPVVCVLEAPNEVRAQSLFAAGADAVLTKPIRFFDIESFLNG